MRGQCFEITCIFYDAAICPAGSIGDHAVMSFSGL
jgi:hypothetical protein